LANDAFQDAAILALRVGIVALLYVFLISLVLLSQRELRQERQARQPAVVPANLIVVDPGTSATKPGDVIALEPVTRLGRGDGNTLILDDEFVSAHHALLVHRDGGWWVRDDGSTNGTLVNGERIDGEVSLQEGDDIQIGQVVLRLTT
jgi:pSer/pThr/pTyr-binding forkhead associated (FHA) protein